MKIRPCLAARIFVHTLAAFSAIVGGGVFSSREAQAACGTTTITWQADAGTTAWNNTLNWDVRIIPANSTHYAIIKSDWTVPLYPANNYTLACVYIRSGALNVTTGQTLTIAGDYFRNLNAGSLTVPVGSTWTISMNGAAAQTFENVDTINYLTLNNSTSVELTQSFAIRNSLTITAGTGNVYIDKTVTLQNAAAPLVIPSSTTVEVKAGGALWALGGITVNGVLKIDAGARVFIGNGKTLSVPAGGVLALAGSSGNIASIDADQGGDTYNLNIAGSVNLNNFSISRTTAAGLNVTGSIQALSNGDFHYIAGGGYAVTLGAAVTSPATWSTIGFYDDFNNGTARNVNASAYTGSVITINNWSGIGGAAKANDPASKLSWGAQAPVYLQVSNATPTGNPPATIAKGSAATYFATFGFSLTDIASSTDITALTFTIDGVNSASDINYIQVFKDVNTNCVYNAGIDTQIGGNLTVAGSPPTATVSIGAGVLTVSNSPLTCVHVLVATNSTANTGDTLAIKIAGTADVANSRAYSFSNSGGPPVEAGFSTITGAAVARWQGGNGTPPFGLWAQANNWTPAAIPTNATDCQIGNAYTYPRFAAAQSCQNVTLQTTGSLDWNNTASNFSVYGGLTVQSGFTFVAATAGPGLITIAGSTNQSISFQSAWPGNITVNSTGGTVSIDNNWTINGNYTQTAGNVSVSSGYTLTLLGNMTINGGTFTLQPGATLKMGNGKSITVAAAATLQIVGSASQNVIITSDIAADSYTLTVNGTIKARYYSFSNLGATGVTIAAGATIDATNYLQDGSFTYPVPNNAVMLTLNRQIPGNALTNMTFDSNGSAATGTTSINTNAAAGTLTISNYSGDRTGATYTNAPVYTVTWSAPTTTLKLARDAAGPTSANSGQTYNMGRFSLQQTQAGPYLNTNITALKLTLTGTGSSADITAARIFYDSGCTGSGGTQLGTGTFSGNPSTVNFTGLSGAVIDASTSAPPKRCIYVEYDVSASANNGDIIGAKIAASGDVTNSQSYAFNGSFAPPVDLGTGATVIGTSTTWTGTVSNNWYTPGNWTGGVPTSALNCIINSATNHPDISTGTATCKTINIGNGTLTMTAGAAPALELYGDFTNTGTFTQNSQIVRFRDNGAVATNSTISGTITFDSIAFNKTVAGGKVMIPSGASVTASAFTIPAGNNFTFEVQNSGTLTLPTGATITSSVLQVDGGGTVKIGSGNAITVNGGTFKTAGIDDGYPQATTNKALMTVNGAGTWSFTATSGTVDLTGFLFDWLDTNGLNIGGTTTLANLNGGQLRNLSTSYASVKAIQLNTTGTIPGTANDFGWNWGPNNTPPADIQAYYLAASTGCGNQTISFNNWFGDWFVNVNDPVPSTKVSAVSCTINIAAAAAPVSLTSFTATPYNSSVVLNWATGLEWAHQGFNVYRSLSPSSGFAQINASLIRNTAISTTIHGNYQFYDNTAINGLTYYYMLEDFAVNGTRTMHGPVSATPNVALGAAPPPDPSAIGANANNIVADTPPPVNPFAPEERQLAPGVMLLAETNHSLRLRIDIPDFSTSPALFPPYVHVSMQNYAVKTDAGLPELPERIIMVEIPPSATATSSIVSNTHHIVNGVEVAPALQWTAVGASLVSSWAIDAAFYGTNQFLPATPVSLGQITQSQGKYFLPVVVDPLSFNPVTSVVDASTQVIVDITLDGAPAWAEPAPGTGGPWAVEGALKINVSKPGVYTLSYSDLTSASVDGPFAGRDVSRFKMYWRGIELPLQMNSPSGFFSPGDSISYFAPFRDNFENRTDAIVLITDSAGAPGQRMSTLNGTISSMPASSESSYSSDATVEQNTFELLNEPYAENVDHILWARIFTPVGAPGDDTFSTNVTLPNLASSGNVIVTAILKGSVGASIFNGIHHVKLFVNGSNTAAGDLFIPTTGQTTAQLTVPASQFVPGLNRISMQVIGDLMAPDYDAVNVDKITVSYPHNYIADSDAAAATTTQSGTVLTVSGFTNNDIVAFDTTNISATAVIGNTTISNVAAGNYEVQFATAGGDPQHGRATFVTRASQIPHPDSLQLIAGSSLHDTNQGADVIFIAPKALIDSITPLADLRSRQGFRVKMVDIESIFLEFGSGMRGGAVMKSFIQYAATQWQAPAPQYLVLVGDSTTDPKNSLGYAPANTLPIHLLKGTFWDYGADNWMVAFNANDDLPTMSIGRIPGNTPALITTYVNKVLAYESGIGKPAGAATGNITFISDIDQVGGENFAPRVQALGSLASSWNSALNVTQLSRTTMTDAQLHNSIVNAFNSGQMLVHYFGHGAEDRWAASTVFMNADADALTNQVLPIVMSMNCLNGTFYYADPTYQTLAERFLFNPNGGAIAVWASTSLTSPDVQIPYQLALYNILATTKTIRLGDAVRLAKVQGGWTPAASEVINSWTLIGDPMLMVTLPGPSTGGSGGGGGKNSGGGFACGTTGAPPEPPTPGGILAFALVVYAMYRLAHAMPARSRRRSKS